MYVCMCLFRHSFFCVPLKNVLVLTPGGTRTQVWESLSYHIPVCKEASKRTYVPLLNALSPDSKRT
jgi:hypothetical protein